MVVSALIPMDVSGIAMDPSRVNEDGCVPSPDESVLTQECLHGIWMMMHYNCNNRGAVNDMLAKWNVSLLEMSTSTKYLPGGIVWNRPLSQTGLPHHSENILSLRYDPVSLQRRRESNGHGTAAPMEIKQHAK